jgi:hypothetical protein
LAGLDRKSAVHQKASYIVGAGVVFTVLEKER